MKKIILVLLCFAMLATMVSCSENERTEGAVDASNPKDSNGNINGASNHSPIVENDGVNPASTSPQIVFYNTFQEAVSSNAYDEWLEQALADGIMSTRQIYAKYSQFWVHEFHYSISVAEGLFDDTENYSLWKSELEKWLETTTNVTKIETEQVIGQMQQGEMILQTCKLVRQKVIDIKYFCYTLEHRGSDDILENLVGLKWANNLCE